MFLFAAPTQEGPDPNDVVAGWGAFWLFMGLAAVVVFLLWHFTRQLRKVDAATKAGVLPTKAEVAASRREAAKAGASSADADGNPESAPDQG